MVRAVDASDKNVANLRCHRATLAPGSSVSVVARRYDVNANQVFAWRRRYRGAPAEPARLQLMPVTVMAEVMRPVAPMP